MPGGRQDIFCFVLQNSAIRCAKVPFLVKILLTNFIHFREKTHTHTPYFQETILKRIYFWTTERFLGHLPYLAECPGLQRRGWARKLLRVDTALNTELGHPLLHFSPKMTLAGVIIAPILRMKKLRLRAVKWFTQVTQRVSVGDKIQTQMALLQIPTSFLWVFLTSCRFHGKENASWTCNATSSLIVTPMKRSLCLSCNSKIDMWNGR